MNFSFPENRKKNSGKNLVIGVNLSNNGSICALYEGKVIFYLEAERLTRKKWDHRVKTLIKYLPQASHIALADSHWVRGNKKVDNIKDLMKFKKEFPDAKIHDYRKHHHLTHAACAYYNSGFRKASCIVVDSNGSKTSEGLEIESIFSAPNFTTTHKRIFGPDSIGCGRQFEETALVYGWDHRDAGKVMGMSAYNDEPAFSTQLQWEQRYEELLEMRTSNNVVVSGGCFLNCVANYKMKKKFPHINLYVEPIAHDGGTAIGAAYLAYYETKT
tara:strand:+ start:6791 stop:7606 length:816 start_codon:yes stop_codon:yes gene_type:complete